MVKGRQNFSTQFDSTDSASSNSSHSSSSQSNRSGTNSKADAPSFTTQTEKDSIQVDEVGDHWLHVQWEISSKTLARADSAMGRDGYKKQRVIRVSHVDPGETGLPNKRLLTQIEVPENVREWFLFVPEQVPDCLVELGNVFGKGRYFTLLRSNPITFTPQVPSRSTISPLVSSSLEDEIDTGDPPPLVAEGTFVLTGMTRPGSRMQIDDQAVEVDPKTGKFEWRIPLSNGRVVVPVLTSDGRRSRRALLAIETNFHLLPPEPLQDDL